MKFLKNNLTILLCAVLTFFFLSFDITENVLTLLPVSGHIAEASCVTVVLFFLYKKLSSWYPEEYHRGFYLLAALLSMIFSFISVVGVFFSAKPDMSVSVSSVLAGDAGSFLRTLAVLLGGFFLFFFFICAVGAARHKLGRAALPEKISDFVFGRNSFLKTMGIMLVCWLPHIIIRFPGSIPTDGVVSLLQYYGVREYTTQHPIIYTLLLGRLCDLGAALGSTKIGFFLLVLIQTACLLLVLAYTLRTMEKLHVPRWFCLVTLGLFSVVPIFPGYATLLIIDVFYSTAILLLANQLAWYLFCPDVYKKSWKHLCLTAVSVLAAFFRQNGFYVAAVLLVFTGIRELYLLRRKEQVFRYTAVILAVILLPLCAGKMNNALLHRKYQAGSVSSRAVMALPLQQTARYLSIYGEETAPEDLAVIRRVLNLDIQQIREDYNPYNYDGIKRGFQFGASRQELADYFQVWFRLLLKHPMAYVNATLHQNYCLFSPRVDNSKYYAGIRRGLQRVTAVDFSPVYAAYEANVESNQALLGYYEHFSRIPFLGLYVNQGVMTLLLLSICLYALFDRNGRLLLLALPLLLTLAVTFVGPAAYGHPRYLFPILYSMPLLFGIFLTGQGKTAAKKIKR